MQQAEISDLIEPMTRALASLGFKRKGKRKWERRGILLDETVHLERSHSGPLHWITLSGKLADRVGDSTTSVDEGSRHPSFDFDLEVRFGDVIRDSGALTAALDRTKLSLSITQRQEIIERCILEFMPQILSAWDTPKGIEALRTLYPFEASYQINPATLTRFGLFGNRRSS